MNHNKNIKVYQTLIKFSLLVLTFFLLSFNLTCKDPEEFKPVDSLLPPPQAPEFSLPLADTIFWIPNQGSDTIGTHTKPTYFSKIRAGSNLWTWFTDWSEIRQFHILRDTTGNSALNKVRFGLCVSF